MREHLRRGTIGEPTAAQVTVGQHLSQWRPGTDARASVSARHELGGGVLLELSHELDALRYVLDSDVETVLATTLERDGAPTDGVVETVADLHLRMTGGLDASVHLDMTSTDGAARTGDYVGTDGAMNADLLAGTITLDRDASASTVVASFPPGERDRAERRLLAHLVDIESAGATPRCTLDDGLAALAIVDAARRCAADGGSTTVTVGARSGSA